MKTKLMLLPLAACAAALLSSCSAFNHLAQGERYSRSGQWLTRGQTHQTTYTHESYPWVHTSPHTPQYLFDPPN